MPPPPAALLMLLLALAVGVAHGANDLASDAAALQGFLAPFGSASVSWNSSQPTCSWTGVVCTGGRVTEIHLPGDGLRGTFPVGALGNLNKLTVLSLRYNALSGPMPPDLASCVQLRVINLQSNHLSGELPVAILALPALTQLNLADNRFSGRIPPTIAKNGKLQLLYLNGNILTGELPNVNMPLLASLNVSFNNLTGEIPKGLGGMPATSFLGMPLCGKPLLPCRTPISQSPSQDPAPPPEAASSADRRRRGGRHLAGGAIAGIVIGCAFGFLLIAAVLVLACGALRRKPRAHRSQDAVAAELALHSKEAMSPNGYTPRVSDARPPPPPPPSVPPAVAPAAMGRKKLFFFGRVPRPYDLEDLLRASAEVLGKGTYGTTYKATLESGPVVAVKRLKETSLPEREFRDKIAAIGGMDHPNVVPLQAYYFSKDEKLMVYEFVAMGSLSSMLHGNRGSGRSPLNWESRRRIALASARGLEYIHATGSKITYGNIKSSNLLLGRSVGARVVDHGLASLVGPAGALSTRVTGYRAPEVVADPRQLSQEADVYSYGMLLLELLTGKTPTHTVLHDEGVDLPRWARSVVHEEWTSKPHERTHESKPRSRARQRGGGPSRGSCGFNRRWRRQEPGARRRAEGAEHGPAHAHARGAEPAAEQQRCRWGPWGWPGAVLEGGGTVRGSFDRSKLQGRENHGERNGGKEMMKSLELRPGRLDSSALSLSLARCAAAALCSLLCYCAADRLCYCAAVLHVLM